MRWAGIFLIAAGLAACSGGRSSSGPAPKTSGFASSTVTPAASATTARPQADTPGNTPAATPAKRPPIAPSPFAGKAQAIDDPAGDVLGPDGKRATRRVAGSDLTRVEIRDGGDGLRITFTVSGAMPRKIDGETDYNAIAYHVVGGDRPDRFSLELGGEEWVATVYNSATGASRSYAGRISVGTDTVNAFFRYAELPVEYAKPFRWKAETEYAVEGKVFHDYVPGDGNDTARFPA